MYRKYKELIKQINDGKNLEAVLPEYAGELSGLLYEYALLQSAMEFYSLKEMVEDVSDVEEEISPDINRLCDWVKEVMQTEENGESREMHIREIDALRTEVMEKVECLTMYADELQIYEYVFNRKEKEYQEEKNVMSDEAFVSRLLQYMFGAKDNVLVNQRIQEAVSQLPVRMLKSKYYDYIKDSLNCYKDADKSSIDSFIYMLRTSATIYKPKTENDHYTSIKENIKMLEAVDYNNLSQEEFEKYSKVLKDTAFIIAMLSDFNVQIAKVINSLYIVLLMKPYLLSVKEEVEKNCCFIISSTAEHLWLPLSEELEEKVCEVFDELLGVQEQHIEDYLYFSGGLSVIKEEYWELTQSIALDFQMECLYMADKLCNNSIFINIHEEEESHQVTSDYLEYQFNHLVMDLTQIFKKHPQCINRAIMAATLSKLPVFFNNTQEVKEYVEQSLFQCTNAAEKSAAKELLLSLMAQGTV